MRWRLALVVLVVACAVGLSRASGAGVEGLTVEAFRVDEIPPVRDGSRYESCGEMVLPNVAQNWGGGVVAGCASDRVMLHYSGTLEMPAGEIRFFLVSDDGGWAQVGDTGFGYWGDRSCWGSMSPVFQSDGGTVAFEDWYYENGGGACNILYWSVDGGPWRVVDGFTVSPPEEPTTTSSSSTTTTEMPTTSTTEGKSPSTMPVVVSTTSTTLAPVLSSSTTDTSEPRVPPSVTSSTTITETSTTVVDSVPAPTTPTTRAVSPSEPPKQSTTTTTPPATFAPSTTLPPPAPNPDLSALTTATDPAALAALTPDKATEVFAAIDNPTDAEAAAIIAAVQDAPPAIRAAFETTINIYSGKFDNYIPLGSVVSVKTRRTIIAATSLTLTATMPRRKHE